MNDVKIKKNKLEKRVKKAMVFSKIIVPVGE